MSQPATFTNYSQINPLLSSQLEVNQIDRAMKIVDLIPVVSTVANIGLLLIAAIFKIQDMWYEQKGEPIPQGIPLKMYTLEIRSTSQYLIGLVPFTGFIVWVVQACRPFNIELNPIDSPEHGVCRSKTYQGGSDETNCDLVIATERGGIVHLDGTAHNKKSVVDAEHPVIRNFAENWGHFISAFDFTTPQALNQFMQEESNHFNRLNKDHMLPLFDEYDGLQIEIGKQRTAVSELLFSHNQNAFNELRNFLDLEEVERYCNRMDRELKDKPDQLSEQLLVAYRFLIDNNCDDFNDEWNKIVKGNQQDDNSQKQPSRLLDTKFGQQLSGEIGALLLKSKENPPSRRTGSAFGLTQPLPIGDGYIFFRNLADICLMVMHPRGEKIEVQPNGSIDLNSVDIMWVGQTNTQFGDDPQQTNRGVHLLGPFPKGAIAFSFSDGIGEFLTRDEIKVCYAQHALSGSDAVLHALHTKILEYARDSNIAEDAPVRMQATRDKPNENHLCKQLDPLNPTYHDDTSCGQTSLLTKDGSSPMMMKLQTLDPVVADDPDAEKRVLLQNVIKAGIAWLQADQSRLQTEGLLRTQGGEADSKVLKVNLMQNASFMIEENTSVHTVVTAVKRSVSEAYYGLMAFTADELNEWSKLPDVDKLSWIKQKITEKLPEENEQDLIVFEKYVQCLNQIAQCSKDNLMTVANLSRLFGPVFTQKITDPVQQMACISHSIQMAAYLIDNVEDIFSCYIEL